MNFKNTILTGLSLALTPIGFTANSSTFVRDLGSVVHLIELQQARESTRATSVHTLNVGVLSPMLIPPDVRAERMKDIGYAHWSLRLGRLSPENVDFWWTSTSESEAVKNSNDMIFQLQEYALPMLQQLSNSDALISLWRSGRSPGLTAVQRDNLLRQVSA